MFMDPEIKAGHSSFLNRFILQLRIQNSSHVINDLVDKNDVKQH